MVSSLGYMLKKFDRVETPAIRWLNAVHMGIRTVVASSTLTRASQSGKSLLALGYMLGWVFNLRYALWLFQLKKCPSKISWFECMFDEAC
jgi:hypothetical protein